MTQSELPSFIVVGPPHTGTSWLHTVLAPHTRLPSPTRETRFFDLYFERGFAWYRSHYPAQRHPGPMGEVAPTYFASDEARQRIAESIPSAKLVFMFRNPVQRVVSLYRMKRAYGMIPWALEEAIEKDPELMTTGMYSTQLAAWRSAFPDRQILLTLYDDLQKDPQRFATAVTSFIGMPAIILAASQTQRVYVSERMTKPRSYLATKAATAFADWCKARQFDKFVADVRESSLINLFLGGGEPLSDAPPNVLHNLANIFKPEVEGLETVLGRNLDAWKAHHEPASV